MWLEGHGILLPAGWGPSADCGGQAAAVPDPAAEFLTPGLAPRVRPAPAIHVFLLKERLPEDHGKRTLT